MAKPHVYPTDVTVVLYQDSESNWVGEAPDCAVRAKETDRHHCLDSITDQLESRLEYCKRHEAQFYALDAVAKERWKNIALHQMAAATDIAVSKADGEEASPESQLKYNVFVESPKHAARVSAQRSGDGKASSGPAFP